MGVRDRLKRGAKDLKSDLAKDAEVSRRTVRNREVITREDARQLLEKGKRGGRKAVEVGRKAGQAAADADIDVDKRDERTEEMFAGAEEAATMAGPVDATLDPVTGPESMEDFATGNTRRRRERQKRQERGRRDDRRRDEPRDEDDLGVGELAMLGGDGDASDGSDAGDETAFEDNSIRFDDDLGWF